MEKRVKTETIYDNLPEISNGMVGLLSISPEYIDDNTKKRTNLHSIEACVRNLELYTKRQLTYVGIGTITRSYDPGPSVVCYIAKPTEPLPPPHLSPANELTQQLIFGVGATRKITKLKKEVLNQETIDQVNAKVRRLARVLVAAVVRQAIDLPPNAPTKQQAEAVAGLLSVVEGGFKWRKLYKAASHVADHSSQRPEINISLWENDLERRIGWWFDFNEFSKVTAMINDRDNKELKI